MRIKTFTILLFMISIYSVSAQKSYSIDLNIKTEPTEKITVNETELGLSIFGNIDAKNKITNTIKYKNIGINYSLENYNLQNSLNQFNYFENDFELSHQLTEKTKLIFEIKPIVTFESNLGISDVSLLGGLEVNHVFNATTKISFGAKRTTLFGKPQILPSLSIYHQINKDAFVEIGFPNAKISYSNNIRNTFRLTNSFNGSFYNLDHNRILDDYTTATKVSFSQITSAFEYERNVDTNWFVSFKGGYDFNKSYNLTNDTGNKKFDFKIDNGYIFNIGIKYKH